MNPYKILILYLVGLLVIISCNSEQNKPTYNQIQQETHGELIADSIIYDVIIRALDDEDPWEVDRLKSLNQDKLIGLIFDQLNNGSYTAYSFDSHSKLTIKEIEAITKKDGFDKQKISKIQFNEMWYTDTLGYINKRINSITLGIESYSKQGTFLGYEALFIVKFEPNH